MGVLIGKRGQTLDALQYLTNLAVNKNSEEYVKVKIDTEDYRKRRRETLENLAKNIAYKVKRTKRPVSLEPMNPYERRIIHTAVQTVEGAKSWSEGTDLARHVVIGPEGGERIQRRDNRRPGGKDGRRSGGYDRDRRSGSRPPRSTGTRQQTPVSRPEHPKADDPTAPIYGKIEAKK